MKNDIATDHIHRNFDPNLQSRAFPAALSSPGLPKKDPVTDTTFEAHHTIDELAKRWKLSRESVRKQVIKERDVLRLTRGKKVSYRIPDSVARRIHTRLFNPAA